MHLYYKSTWIRLDKYFNLLIDIIFIGGSLPDILQYVNVPLMTNEDCKKTGYGSSAIKDSMVCAGYDEGKKDSCQGDSGLANKLKLGSI